MTCAASPDPRRIGVARDDSRRRGELLEGMAGERAVEPREPHGFEGDGCARDGHVEGDCVGQLQGGRVDGRQAADARVVDRGEPHLTWNAAAIVWSLHPDDWLSTACRAAGRNLTRTEWVGYLGPNKQYRATCCSGRATATVR